MVGWLLYVVASTVILNYIIEIEVHEPIWSQRRVCVLKNVKLLYFFLRIIAGNHLQSTWLEVLKCISSLEASELMRQSVSRSNGPNNSRTPSPSPSQSMDNSNEAKSWLGWAGSFVPSFWDYSGKLDSTISIFILFFILFWLIERLVSHICSWKCKTINGCKC